MKSNLYIDIKMVVEWSPNDWSNILTVGAAALCSLLMVLFKSRCSKINLCWGIFSCDRVVQDDEDKTKPADNANEVALVNQPEPVILPPPQPNIQVQP